MAKSGRWLNRAGQSYSRSKQKLEARHVTNYGWTVTPSNADRSMPYDADGRNLKGGRPFLLRFRSLSQHRHEILRQSSYSPLPTFLFLAIPAERDKPEERAFRSPASTPALSLFTMQVVYHLSLDFCSSGTVGAHRIVADLNASSQPSPGGHSPLWGPFLNPAWDSNSKPLLASE